ncbi:MAG: PIN domain-containing protein [Trueperaceae bacterium]|nr:PIN domain-containing protein [Trueperaceae bacterium]
MNAVVDTNVLIDYLQGRDEAARELERYRVVEVSAVSAAELWAGATTEKRENVVESLLATCVVVPVDDVVAREAGWLRRTRRVRLPDAIVWATARVRGYLLVTRDEGFPADAPEVRHPYRLEP